MSYKTISRRASFLTTYSQKRTAKSLRVEKHVYVVQEGTSFESVMFTDIFITHPKKVIKCTHQVNKKKNYLAKIKVLILKGLPKRNLAPDKIGHSWKGDFHSLSGIERIFLFPCAKMMPWEAQRARLKPQAGRGARAQRRLHTPPRPTLRPFAASREQVETAPGYNRCNYLPAPQTLGLPRTFQLCQRRAHGVNEGGDSSTFPS